MLFWGLRCIAVHSLHWPPILEEVRIDESPWANQEDNIAKFAMRIVDPIANAILLTKNLPIFQLL